MFSLRRLLNSLTFLVMSLTVFAAGPEPVTPQASPEARALLQLFQELSGKYVLTGQHNYPAAKDRNTLFAAQHIGKVPAIWSSDWGHADKDHYDSYLARPDIVAEAIRQHKLGSIITLCWHAVPPTADEPVTFHRPADTDPERLRSVQGQLTDAQFRDILTPGTALHRKWEQQVDVIAGHLRQLEEAKVPVLWRPYHEMNGDWFWWGGRRGEYSTIRLYRQLFDRLVHHHGLKNLVWVWNVDRVHREAMEHHHYFPGLEFADILSLDVYHNDFAQKYYDSLVALAGPKPLLLGEVGNPPSLEVLAQQPRWASYVIWAGMAKNTPRSVYQKLFENPRVLNWGDSRYAEVTATYRQQLGLPKVAVGGPKPTFTGQWVLDEDRTPRTGWGLESVADRLEVHDLWETVRVRSVKLSEFAADESEEEAFSRDGSPSEMTSSHGKKVSRLQASEGVLKFVSEFYIQKESRHTEVQETWTLSPDGRSFTLERRFTGPRGPVETRAHYLRLLAHP